MKEHALVKQNHSPMMVSGLVSAYLKKSEIHKNISCNISNEAEWRRPSFKLGNEFIFMLGFRLK